jgi:hypothetical protein
MIEGDLGTWEALGDDRYRLNVKGGGQAEVELISINEKWQVEVLSLSGRMEKNKTTRKIIEFMALKEVAQLLRVVEVTFRDFRRTKSKTQRITIQCMPGESARERFERDCRRFGRSWGYVSDEDTYPRA